MNNIIQQSISKYNQHLYEIDAMEICKERIKNKEHIVENEKILNQCCKISLKNIASETKRMIISSTIGDKEIKFILSIAKETNYMTGQSVENAIKDYCKMFNLNDKEYDFIMKRIQEIK